MIRAAIDVGSNSVRMLLHRSDRDDSQYFRQVTRLAGDFNPESGLMPQSMARTLRALGRFAGILKRYQVEEVRTVGTAALRHAVNSFEFIENVRKQTGLSIEIIDGEKEAGLSCRGILSVLDPAPQRALLFDIGGGSTELILVENDKIHLQQSVPLGVVRLLEDYPDPDGRHAAIRQGLASLAENSTWQGWQQTGAPIELVGTAGTVTTLAALKLKMEEYDGRLVNNLILERNWLEHITKTLTDLPLDKRVALPGMEEGRADIIIPGLQLVRALLDIGGCDHLRVADAGLLEGLLLE